MADPNGNRRTSITAHDKMAAKEADIGRLLEKFAAHTTMHGLPRIINAKSCKIRCIWSFVCVSAIVIFCVQISIMLAQYFAYPKRVTIEVVPSGIPFPAVTVCNIRNLDFEILQTVNDMFLKDNNPSNHLNKSDVLFINKYVEASARVGLLYYNYSSEYPDLFERLFSRTTLAASIPQSIIQEAATQLDTFVVLCEFGEQHCLKSRNITQFFDPYYYNCYTFSGFGSKDKITAEGLENGLSAIFFAGNGFFSKNNDSRIIPGLTEFGTPTSSNEGIHVVIHPSDVTPYPFTEGYDVPTGFSASFGIKSRHNIRLDSPYGKCSATNSLFDKEKQYRIITCQKLCMQKAVIETCGCTDIGLPLLSETNVTWCLNLSEFPDHCMFNASTICLNKLIEMKERSDCVRNTKANMSHHVKLFSSCECHPACNEVTYDITYSLARWPAGGFEGDAAFSNILYTSDFVYKLNEQQQELLNLYFDFGNRRNALKDFTRLNVYIADGNVVTTAEVPDYTITNLFSDIGGLLGLWVGISVITVAEFMEFLMMIPQLFLKRRQNIRKNERDIPVLTHDNKNESI